MVKGYLINTNLEYTGDRMMNSGQVFTILHVYLTVMLLVCK